MVSRRGSRGEKEREREKKRKKCSKHWKKEIDLPFLFPPLARFYLAFSLRLSLSPFSASASIYLSLSQLRFTLIFSFPPFVCLSLQLGNCPGYFRIHRNATIADMHCRGDDKGAQWVIFHTLFAKMWRSNSAEGLNAGGALLLAGCIIGMWSFDFRKRYLSL